MYFLTEVQTGVGAAVIRRAKAILLEVKGKGDIEDPDVVVKGSVSVQLEAKGEKI